MDFMTGANLPTMARVIIINNLAALTPNTAIGYTFLDNGLERIVLDDVQLPSEVSIDDFMTWCSDTMKIEAKDIKFVDAREYQRGIESYYSSIFKTSLEEIDLPKAVALQQELRFEQMPCETGYAFKACNKQPDQSCSWIVKSNDSVYFVQHFDDSKPEEVIAFVHDAIVNPTKKVA
ncbi:hypothetical protein [Vibrio owensii]|uniref:Uncharacterized protein n=1 Tax=Vibrio owensii CAIM 1854 = LMG 25443 TaxID=1229493 RepID=A0A0C1ZJL5_9VIBR|nr:hypothetical protein [Vibrio owensii]KIF53356.1 hypothetical protein H735_10570 [Vibrio owensii CAIM 1854 = LMG 25443]